MIINNHLTKLLADEQAAELRRHAASAGSGRGRTRMRIRWPGRQLGRAKTVAPVGPSSHVVSFRGR
jgi:hypothetical protein